MENLTLNEIIDRISDRLIESDSDTICDIYNKLFDIPLMYMGDDTYEEEIVDTFSDPLNEDDEDLDDEF